MTSSTPSPSAQELADKLDNIAKHDCTCSYAKALRLSATLLRRLSETERERDGWHLECIEVEQTLGKALGYPWYKDDQKNFPSATEKDGVCVGEHVPGSIASEAAKRLLTAEAERDALREMLAQADAAHAYEQWTIDGKGAAPMTQQEYYQRYDEARHRHRLSQKGK